MSATQGVFADIVMLARENGWSGVVTFADQIRDRSEQTLLVSTSADPDLDPLAAWILAEAPGVELRRAMVSELSTDAGPQLDYGRVVVAHPSGVPLTAASVELIRVVRSRPAASYLIVLIGLSAVEHQVDLDLVQRNMWRLLVDPDGRWARQDLTEYGFVMWTAGRVPELLTERVVRERELAAAWLGDREAGAGKLQQLRARHLLDLAEAGAQATAAPSSDRASDRRLTELAEQASQDGRASVLGRLASVSRTAQTLVRDALTTLEQELILGLPRHLAANRTQFDAPGPARATLERYVTDRVQYWQTVTAPNLVATIQRQGRDIPDVFGEVDWDLINKALGSAAEQRFPRTVLSTIDLQLGSLGAEVEGTVGWDVTRTARPTQNPTPYLVAGALGAAIGVVAGGALGLVFGGAAGIAGATYLMRRRSDGRPVDDQILRSATAAIRSHFAEGARAVPAAIEATLAPLAVAVNKEFDDVDRALAGARAATSAGSGQDAVAEKLASLRRRLARD